jgi:hypothetical protein
MAVRPLQHRPGYQEVSAMIHSAGLTVKQLSAVCRSNVEDSTGFRKVDQPS